MRKLLVVTMALAGCALPQTVPEALSTEYTPSGHVQLFNRGASFDAVRVRSPQANISKRTDGTWAGTLRETFIDVSVTDTHVRGANILLTRGDSTAGHYVVTGQVNGRIVRFELDQDQALIRTTTFSTTLTPRTLQADAAAYGPRSELQLRGQAALIDPPWPQMAFALVAAFD